MSKQIEGTNEKCHVDTAYPAMVQSKILEFKGVPENACQRLEILSNFTFFQDQGLQVMELREVLGFFLKQCLKHVYLMYNFLCGYKRLFSCVIEVIFLSLCLRRLIKRIPVYDLGKKKIAGD
jgi:hypothetical protein